MAQNPFRLQIKGGGVSPAIKVPSSACTILEVKEHIEAGLGVEIARQTLWSRENEKMEDSKTIDDYDGWHVIRLEVEPPAEDVTREIIVFSRSDNEHKCVVKETETVIELKKKAEEKLEAKAEDIKLFKWEHPDELMNDQPLYKYYIRDGSRIFAKINRKIGGTSGEASKKTDSKTGST